MSVIRYSSCSLLLYCLISFGSSAIALELHGTYTQGGLLEGQTHPDAKVTLDGEAIRVNDDGRFLIGFDRDAGPEAELVVVYPDGDWLHRTLAIEQREYRIQRIDGLPDRQVTPSAADLERIRNEAEQMTAARERAFDTDTLYLDDGFIWPVTGRITGVFGSQRILNGEPRRPHNGVDIAANTGTPIVAPAAGVVAFVHPDMYFNGATVILDHGHGLTSVYCHLHRIKVEPGQYIEQGQPLGEVGATGRVTGPHLHWGVDHYRNRIDPKLLVGAMPD